MSETDTTPTHVVIFNYFHFLKLLPVSRCQYCVQCPSLCQCFIDSNRFLCAPDDIISTSEVSNDKQHEESLKSTAGARPEEPVQESSSTVVNSSEAEVSSSEITPPGEVLLDPLVLLCCENSLHLLSAKALIEVFYSIISLSRTIRIHIVSLIANEFDVYDIFLQGNKKPIRKVEHSKSFYWTTILKKDDKVCGILSLLQTGTFEIR